MTGANKANAMSLIDEIDAKDGADYGDANSVLDSGDDDDAGNTGVAGGNDDDSDAGDDSLTQESQRQSQRVQREEEQQRAPQRREQKNDNSKQQSVRQYSPEELKNMQPLPNGLLQDAKGNLVHPTSGQVIAYAGSHRKLYERNQRIESQFNRVNSDLQRVQKELAETKAASTYHTKFGLSNEDVAVGMPIIAEFVKDPVQAARKVLEMVVGMGHSLDSILDAKGISTIETNGLSRMLDERLAPLQQVVQTQRKTVDAEDLNTRAEQAVLEFFDKHEYAMMHAPVIDQLLGKRAEVDPSYTPEQAYRDLELWAAKNGLDFSKPLQPQMARQQGATQQETATQGARRNGSLPNGRSSGATHLVDERPVEANTSWEDIIRNSMRTMTTRQQ